MAENKRSFILYADMINVVDQLNDKEAGQLIKLILKYVNDMNPKAPNRLIALTFEPIKAQLKRDLKKFEKIKEKRSDAGKMGGRPKKQTKAKKANAFLEKQTKAKKADTVTDTVTVNDTVYVDSKESSISVTNVTSPPLQKLTIDHVVNYYNENRGNMPECRMVTETRKNRLNVWSRKPGGLDNLIAAIDKARVSPLLQGMTKGRDWRGSFDWIIKPENTVKILEGNYDYVETVKVENMSEMKRKHEIDQMAKLKYETK